MNDISNFKIGKYKHYKGGIYDVLALGKHTEREEVLVLYANKEKQIWARPYNMFIEYVDVDGKKVKRFEYIGDE
jgi:hypothetical protein